MPYNPGSAYPRKTTYVPPTYGDTSFQRAVNAPDFVPNSGFGGPVAPGRGRAAYASATGAARGAATAPDAATGLRAMQNQGIAAQLQNRYMEQRGLKQNQEAGTVAPQQPAGTGTPSHGNPAAQAKQAAATELADHMVEQELTGALPGDTGRANVRKSKKTNPNQTTLF